MTNHDGGDGLSGRRVNTIGGATRPSDTKRKTPRGYRAKSAKPDRPAAKPAGQYTAEQVEKFLSAERIELVTGLGNRFTMRPATWLAWIVVCGEWRRVERRGMVDEDRTHYGEAELRGMIQESRSCEVIQ